VRHWGRYFYVGQSFGHLIHEHTQDIPVAPMFFAVASIVKNDVSRGFSVSRRATIEPEEPDPQTMKL
jgi:hypothetical protein